ncbi:MAG TPA: lipoyl(octanoyl) transferase LipB [Myxococcales bacterium]|nr:lipoyl(octanoyl) transferase LipB [Myxococcales bacterium]HIM00454.1 lipoyl(octanoyl) transferase LipB [Myxococcales bacterium]
MPAEPRTKEPSSNPGQPLRVDWLGSVPYRDGLELQEAAMADVRVGGADRLLLLEHPPVITLGRSTDRAHLLEDEVALAARGVAVEEVRRGGDVTYHGPGQLVGYLILNLRLRGAVDVHRFVRDLEAALITATAALGVKTTTVPGRTGVFVAPEIGRPTQKIASIGVGVRHWITYHGFALNVDVDLSGFDAIVPCGLADVTMTSLAEQGADGPLASRAREAVASTFGRAFSNADTAVIAPGS